MVKIKSDDCTGYVEEKPKTLLFESLVFSAIPFLVIAIWCFYYRVDERLIVSGDENMEFAKAKMLGINGYDLKKMWNDQPWLYSYLLYAIDWIGLPMHIVSRALTLFICWVFAATCSRVLENWLAGWRAVFPGCIMAVVSQMAPLMVSAMVELPVQLGCAAVGLILITRRNRFFQNPILFGAIAGVALHFKFTAILPIFASWVVLVFKKCPTWRLRFMIDSAISISICFSILCYVGPHMHYSQLVSAHFGDLSIVGPVGLKQGIGFPIQFFGDLGLWVAALVGLLELKANKDSQPVVLLISVYALGSVVFSFFYRPYWGYYLVHTAVFLVPFASVGFSLFCDILKSNKCILKSGVQLPGFRVQMNELAILTSLSLICGFTLGRAAYDVNAVLSSKTPSQDPLIGEITRSKKGDSMLYTSRPYYGYYCNISLIPEYVVPSFKNVAQNQLNSSNLLVLVRERSVDMLHVLRDVELSDSSWIKYLNENCRLIYAGPSDELWIKDSKKLDFKKENKTEFVDWRLKSIVW